MRRLLVLLLLLPLWTAALSTPDSSNGKRETIIQRYDVLKQSDAPWNERVQSLRPYIGTSLIPRPANLTETQHAQVNGDLKGAARLEKTQTWWIDSSGTFIALRNVIGKPIASLVVEISEGICTNKGRSFFFTLKPEDGKPIGQGEFVVFSFKLPDRFSSGRRCLDIYSVNDLENNFTQQGGKLQIDVQVDSINAERDRLAFEVEAERRKRQELEERIAAEAKERERMLAEAEIEAALKLPVLLQGMSAALP